MQGKFSMALNMESFSTGSLKPSHKTERHIEEQDELEDRKSERRRRRETREGSGR